jgi:hypothetical protein
MPNNQKEKKFFADLIAELNELVVNDQSYGVKRIIEDPANADFILIEKNNGVITHIPKWENIPLRNGKEPKIKDFILAELEKIKLAAEKSKMPDGV